MITKLLEFLEDGLLDASMHGNRLLPRLYSTIRMTHEVPGWHILLAFIFDDKEVQVHTDKQPSIAEDMSSRRILDYRFHQVMMQGVRKFYGVAQDYYGLNFTSSGVPVSSVFLGSNGVGKSSIYAALEQITLHYMFSAEARGFFNKDEQRDYLRNANHVGSPTVILKTGEGEENDFVNKLPIGVPAYFCSEYDIQYLERRDVTPEYICRQVGLSTTVALVNILEKSMKLDDLQVKYQEQKARAEKIEDLLLTDKEQYKREQRDIDFRMNALQNEMVALVGVDDLTLENLSFSDDWKQQASKIVDYLNNRILSEVEPLLSKLKATIPILLSHYMTDGASVVVSVNKTQLNIQICIQDENGIKTLSPRQYFNTFRFKLYCVVLKVCLAYCAKTLNHCNFPMVIDDVFDSSDFDNRYHINRFIEMLVEKHNQLMNASDYPLQILFFTQDDLVSEGVYKGIRASLGTSCVKFGRIYDFSQAQEPDKHKIKVLTSDDIFVNLEDSIVK